MCEASIFLESILKIGNFWNVAFSKVQEKKKRHFRALALLGKCCERQPGTWRLHVNPGRSFGIFNFSVCCQ